MCVAFENARNMVLKQDEYSLYFLTKWFWKRIRYSLYKLYFIDASNYTEV